MQGKCPVCGVVDHIKQVEAQDDDLVLMLMPQPFYQFSYPGEPDYLPPRCERCYDKVMKRRERKHAQK